ncbi:hypothetical protein CQA62_06840, partial [Helicobacter cholecystus]
MPNLFFLLPYFSSLFVLPSIPSLLLNEVAQSASEDARAYLGEWEGRGERENAEIRRRALSFDKEGKW